MLWGPVKSDSKNSLIDSITSFLIRSHLGQQIQNAHLWPETPTYYSP